MYLNQKKPNMDHITLKTPEKMVHSAMNPPYFIPPEKNVFEQRGQRFAQLAAGHEWKNYLEFLSHLSDAQHKALLQLSSSALPKLLPSIEQAPASIHHIALPDCWREVLFQIIEYCLPFSPEGTQKIIHKIQKSTPAQLNNWATTLRKQEIHTLTTEEKSIYVFFQASFQVVWTFIAHHMPEASVQKQAQQSFCPCCATEAVGSVIKIGNDLANFRYLQCPNCNGQWNAVRAKCTFCESTKLITLQGIAEQEKGALHGTRAETCDDCHGYRKLYFLRDEQFADVIADDLASLVLDILIGEEGYQRGGANPFLPMD